MSDSEPPGRSGQPEHNRSFARLRNFLRLIRRPRNGESLRETIDEMIEEPAADDPRPLSAHERVLIGNILKVHDRTAADVMVPRVDIVALDVETAFPEVIKCMVEQGHSRVPVYRETLDDVIGFIHVKDVLAPVADRRQTKLSPILRKVLFVAPSVPILDLLVQMRQARTPIGLLEEHQGTRLRPVGDQEEVDTLGGLVSSLAGRVPKRGEVIAHPSGIEFEVLDADPRRIKRLRVRSPPAASVGKGAPDA